jgi:quinol monooxygenase YgiN
MSHVVMVAKFTVKPDTREAATEALTRCVEASQQEPGVLRYTLHVDSTDPNTFVLIELYRDAEALQAHRTTPHLKALLADTRDLLASPLDVLALTPVGVGDPVKGVLV